MRKEALVIAMVSITGIVGSAWAEGTGMPSAAASQGQALETPNQQRKRLGQPIVASFPAPEYGELIETPNQRRHRLGQPVALVTPSASGVSEETPNQARQRIAAASLIAQK